VKQKFSANLAEEQTKLRKSTYAKVFTDLVARDIRLRRIKESKN